MCMGCNLKDGERIKVISNPATDFVVYIENRSDVFKLHMTDGRHHTEKDIYCCPFCGRVLVKAR